MFYNTLIGSLILSVIVLITIFYFYSDYEIYYIDYFKVFIVSFIASSISLTLHKKYALDEYESCKKTDATIEVFGDISSSQQLNGILQVETGESTTTSKQDKQDKQDSLYNHFTDDDDISLIQIPKIIKRNNI
jgi:hypothetical protein